MLTDSANLDSPRPYVTNISELNPPANAPNTLPIPPATIANLSIPFIRKSVPPENNNSIKEDKPTNAAIINPTPAMATNTPPSAGSAVAARVDNGTLRSDKPTAITPITAIPITNLPRLFQFILSIVGRTLPKV